MNLAKAVWCRQGWFPIPYAFCPSDEAWKAEMRRMQCCEPYPDSDARTSSFEKRGVLRIYVTLAERLDGKDPVGIVGLLVHEAVHVWQAMCEHAGEERPGKETEAYAIQLIACELMRGYADTRMLA